MINEALNIKNWSNGGNSYVLKGNVKNKWVGFQESVINQLLTKYSGNFNIVIWINESIQCDYYCIPYNYLKHLFVEEHKTTGKYPNRWTAIIKNHQFQMHSNSSLSIDISKYYSAETNIHNLELFEDYDSFFIENAKAEINIRIGQSKFRSGVLKNFNLKCAISGISEQSLLTASHIIPWAHNKNTRADIANGICLYNEYDALFDKGYISFTDNLEVIITPLIDTLSNALALKLNTLPSKILNQPNLKAINKSYLSYHRNNILIK